MLGKASDIACNDTCPSWFMMIVLSQWLIPLIWAAMGYVADRRRRLMWFAFAVGVSCIAAYGIHLKTLAFTVEAVSG